MTEAQKATLRKSIESFGFKSLIAVEPYDDGTFGVLDGHHRWEAAQAMGLKEVPVVLIDSDEDGFDLAMLSFNVTADIIPDVYLDFLSELDSRVGPEMLASFTALDEGFLKDLGDTLSNADLDIDLGLNDATHDRSRGGSLTIILPATPEVKAMLATLRSRFGVPTDAEACLSALREVLGEGDEDDDEEDDEDADDNDTAGD